MGHFGHSVQTREFVVGRPQKQDAADILHEMSTGFFLVLQVLAARSPG
jgi:hypothetical protein